MSNDEAHTAATEGVADEQHGRQRRPRSPRNVKSAAKILQREARRILRKHGARIAAEPADAIRASLAAIDSFRNAGRWDALEEEAERLDELLHQHASFARKSALRETVENILIAVLIALGLRSCFYEPFKIPSGSMMPTLRSGDHIFVNKFVYGIQIPFTTTVVGESFGEIERGDVVVFRYPLDESEDFIKRVIGLPGDTVRVSGRQVAIKRAGEEEFEVLERERLDDRCYDESGTKVVSNCTLYEESIDDKTYVVRYLLSAEERGDLMPSTRSFTVPERHLLVMGDNRNQSHDSLAWTVAVEAVSADQLLTLKDLRDLTRDKHFSKKADDDSELGDPRHHLVKYLATHRSRAHDMTLSVWREPSLGAEFVFDTVAERVRGAKPYTMQELIRGKKTPKGAERDRVLAVGEGIDAMVVTRLEDRYSAAVYLEPAQAVLWLECGRRICKHAGGLAMRIADLVETFHRDHEQDARQLLVAPKRVRYGHHWTGRSDIRDHEHTRVFAKPGTEGPRTTVRLRAFRKPDEGIEVVRDAALRMLDSSIADAEALPDVGEDAWLVETPDAWGFVAADHVRDLVVVLECGKAACRNKAAAEAMAASIQPRVPKAASDRRKMEDLLVADDVPGWVEVEQPVRERNAFDRARLEATVRGRDHSVEVEAWLKPVEGLAAKLAQLQTDWSLQPDDAVVNGGLAGEDEDAFTFAFAVEDSQTVVRVTCKKGLCPAREDAIAMARRAAEKAVDPSNFVDPEAERPRPFVPRGNVKGRAERIWLPLSRFWLPIR